MPICTKCAKNVPAATQPGQDNSTFICGECQDKVDLKALEKEADELNKLKVKVNATPSQLQRLQFIENLIIKIKAQG